MNQMEFKPIDLLGYSRIEGKPALHLRCPFCSQEVTVFKWSFASVGKLCDCGAKLTNMHGARRQLKTPKS